MPAPYTIRIKRIVKERENDLFDSLMSNKDFRDWVYDPTQERNQYWQKWMSTSEMHQKEAERARKAILDMRFDEDFLSETELDDMLSAIISRTESTPAPTQEIHEYSDSSTRRLKWYLIAASVVAVLAAGYLFFGDQLRLNNIQEAEAKIKKLTNPEGNRSRIKLPDGSIVNLNAGSSLSFPEEFSGSERVVSLNGEAFFEVVENKEKPFIVETKDFKTRVLGTSFNVRSFEKDTDVKVALTEGEVVVSTLGNEPKLMNLLPGEMMTYDRKSTNWSKSKFNYLDECGWKDNVLFFQDADFKTFVSRLERWYGVKIHIIHPPAKEWKVNGKFEKRESLEQILMGVKFTYGIDYSIDGKNVVLSAGASDQ